MSLFDRKSATMMWVSKKSKRFRVEKDRAQSSFTLDDFLEQLDQVKNPRTHWMDITKMIPGMNKGKG